MVNKRKSVRIVMGVAFLLFNSLASAKVKPHGLFTSNMVIQRDANAPIWGKADPGEVVAISCSWGVEAEATADQNGEWKAEVLTPQAGGPYEISIQGENTIVLKNVMSGDVWVCGGQSNMDFPLIAFTRSDKVPDEVVQHYSEVINNAYPDIRTILIDKQYRALEQEDIVVAKSFGNAWQENTDALINGQTTAVGFLFGKFLQEHLDIPIGLIDSNKGGTAIHLWTSANALGSTNIPIEKDGVAKGSSVLFNGMIAPLMPFAIKGVIWYQGEANSKSLDSAIKYRHDFVTMIQDWRRHWNQGDFPFLFVQLAAFHKAIEEPLSDKHFWPYTRESQTKALSLPLTGMASASDLGLQKNIHPWMKEEVGYRLSLAARKVAYNEKLIASGPAFKSMKVKKNKALICFDNIGSGLEVKSLNLDGIELKSSELKGFIISGKDGKFYHANAKVKGKRVIVSHPAVEAPLVVRYGWTDFPVCNLYNKEGLPAISFRTDDN